MFLKQLLVQLNWPAEDHFQWETLLDEYLQLPNPYGTWDIAHSLSNINNMFKKWGTPLCLLVSWPSWCKQSCGTNHQTRIFADSNIWNKSFFPDLEFIKFDLDLICMLCWFDLQTCWFDLWFEKKNQISCWFFSSLET